MAGTAKGGRAAAEKNKKKHGSDFYARIGRKGGQAGHTGGFAAGAEGRKRASHFGAIGGTISRRS
jgi:general stress protein YciG